MVAVKVLLGSLLGDAAAVQRFHREARTISRLRHPNTVTVFDFGQTPQGDLFLVMEHLEGETLGDVLRRDGRLSAGRAVHILRQACAALEEAHAMGVVHRDLKPDNLFLTRVGSDQDFVKVLDFGLAKLTDGEQTTGITQQGKVFGTPRYMSPEQALGQPLDARSDVYTLGVVLYEMLTGDAPFRADTVLALLLKHIQEPPPPPSQVAPGVVDPVLEGVLLRVLAKDPEARPTSVTELARWLEPWAGRGPEGPRSHPVATATGDLASDLWLDAPLVPEPRRANPAFAATGAQDAPATEGDLRHPGFAGRIERRGIALRGGDADDEPL
jgi:serine/threonine-protein kinase